MTRSARTITLAHTLLPGESIEETVLLVVAGPDRGQSTRLGPGSVNVGTDARCDLVLSDPTVSKVHAQLTATRAGVEVRDRDSRNGIEYLGSKIREAIVFPGATLRLGRTVLALVRERSALPPSEHPSYGPLVGESVAMRRVFALLERVERSPMTLLIEGETGTGKTAIAEAVHARSERVGPLIPIECGALSPELVQSELFGHRRGAFTGATDDRPGAVALADGGTLLVEEIADLPLPLQPTLLRFLETGAVRPVGAGRDRRVDARVIVTTARDLAAEVRAGRFRVDLYYRVAVGRITVPPLRARREDILPLARRFLAEIARDEALDPKTSATLQAYDWPGNLRQLRNALERFVALGTLFGEERPAAPETGFHAAKAELVERFERGYLEALMRRHRGVLSAAARESGLTRHHLRALLQKHGLGRRRE